VISLLDHLFNGFDQRSVALVPGKAERVEHLDPHSADRSIGKNKGQRSTSL
jgi:hypothetical protein